MLLWCTEKFTAAYGKLYWVCAENYTACVLKTILRCTETYTVVRIELWHSAHKVALCHNNERR